MQPWDQSWLSTGSTSLVLLGEVTIGKRIRKDIREGQICQRLVEKLNFIVRESLAQICKFTLIYPNLRGCLGPLEIDKLIKANLPGLIIANAN